MGRVNPVTAEGLFFENHFLIYLDDSGWMSMHFLILDGVDVVCCRDRRQNKPFSRANFEGDLGHIIF